MTVLAIGLVIVLLGIALQPIVYELSLTPSQKLLVTADDLGPGWWSDQPEKNANWRANMTDGASVRLTYVEGSAYTDGRCTLLMLQTREQADECYLEFYNRDLSDEHLSGVEGMSVGDRAYIVSFNNTSGNGGWAGFAIVQKGNWIASIYLNTNGSAAHGAELTVHAAETQAAKLP